MFEVSSIFHDFIFVEMYNIVYIDEKWFNMIKKSENYYLCQKKKNYCVFIKVKILSEKLCF